MGNLPLLQGIFPIQKSNQGLLRRYRQILYHLGHKGSWIEEKLEAKRRESPRRLMVRVVFPPEGLVDALAGGSALNMQKGQSRGCLQQVGPREILKAGERRLKVFPVHIQTHIPTRTLTHRHFCTHPLSLGLPESIPRLCKGRRSTWLEPAPVWEGLIECSRHALQAGSP